MDSDIAGGLHFKINANRCFVRVGVYHHLFHIGEGFPIVADLDGEFPWEVGGEVLLCMGICPWVKHNVVKRLGLFQVDGDVIWGNAAVFRHVFNDIGAHTGVQVAIGQMLVGPGGIVDGIGGRHIPAKGKIACFVVRRV